MLLMWNESDSAAVVVLWNERLLMLNLLSLSFKLLFLHMTSSMWSWHAMLLNCPTIDL